MSHPANDIYTDVLIDFIAQGGTIFDRQAEAIKSAKEAIHGYYGEVLFSANTRDKNLASKVSVETMMQ